MSLTARIKSEARRIGFDLVGVLPVGPSLTHDFYQNWLAQGYAGEMAYLERHAKLKADLGLLAPGARAAIVLAINYHHPAPPSPQTAPPWWGRISRYAWGRDYHDVLQEKLTALGDFIQTQVAHPVRCWSYVDSAPVMERELAARAGLGWVGKHGVVIHWQQGSWLFIAELLVDLPLEYDPPPPAGKALNTGQTPPAGSLSLPFRESCGSCRACMDACPTGAIVAEKTVDSRRCISYHTIELKGPIPAAFRPQLGTWVFGCDICQDVCPWNRRAPDSKARDFAPANARATPSLLKLLALDEAGFRQEFAGTPLVRTKRRGLLRNGAIVLGNQLAAAKKEAALSPGDEAQAHGKKDAILEALQILYRCLQDAEPLIRGAAAWALGQAGINAAQNALQQARQNENDPYVRQEINQALHKLP